MKLGIILYKIPNTNIFIVDIGWGQLRYFSSNDNCKEKDIVLYDRWDNWDDSITVFDWTAYEATYGKSESNKTECESYNDNEIEIICSLGECEFLGNVRYDFHPHNLTKSNIVIARRDDFICWEVDNFEDEISYGPVLRFDLISNSLLFLSYAEPRYPYPDEKKWLEAYTYARRKVEELDIPKMIDELKVEYHKNCWTRRGSDNILISNYRFEYGYNYHYSYLNDYYLENIFPKYCEPLYSSNDDECTYIHPKYEKWQVIRKDGFNEIKKEKFDGLDIEDYCTQKTDELRQVALKNYETYNKDEHIISIAYRHIGWYNIKEECKLFQKMKGLATIVWGYDHHKLLEQITQDNYKELILENNMKYPIPQLPEKTSSFNIEHSNYGKITPKHFTPCE